MPQVLPENGKNPPQHQSQGQFPCQTPGKKPRGIARTEVAAADGEAVNGPDPCRRSQEQPVREICVPGAQGAQKAVDRAQPRPHQAGPEKAARGIRRGGHPSRRRSQPPWARGSS